MLSTLTLHSGHAHHDGLLSRWVKDHDFIDHVTSSRAFTTSCWREAAGVRGAYCVCDFSGYDFRGDEMVESRPPRIKLVGYKRGECVMNLQGAHATLLTQYIWGVDARGF
jgi:hypothetical protein